MKETSYRLDGILHPPTTAWPHLFWEAQFQPDKSFYARWLASIFICLHQEKITAWRGLVVFPNRSLDVGNATPYAPLLEHGLIQRVYLEDLEHVDTERTDWGTALLRLVVAPERQVAAIASDLLAATGGKATGLSRLQAIDLLETVLVYKLPNLSREEIRTMLHLPDTELQDTRFYQEVFAEGEARGIATGEARGIATGEARGEARGLIKGKHQGELALVLRLLHRRLGNLPAHCEDEIHTLPLEQLEILGEDLLDFQTQADLITWLDRHLR